MSPVAIVVPPVALLPLAIAVLTPVPVVVPHVAVLPLAVVVPARRRRRAALLCRLSPSFCRAVVPLVAVLPPVAVVVPHVAVLPLAVVVPPVAVIMLCRRVARRPRFATSSCRSLPSSCCLLLCCP